MDVGLQWAAELELDVFSMGEVFLDRDRNGVIQVKKHTGYECISELKKETKVVVYVASDLIGSVEVLIVDKNMVVIKVGDTQVGGVY